MIAGFEIGCRAPFRVRQERVVTAGAAGTPWRLLFASDLHLTRRRRHLAERLAQVVQQHAPDAVLLGGDLVDRPGGVPELERCVRAMRRCARVVAVPGNHDHRCGLAAVRAAVVDGGGEWLVDGSAVLRDAARPQLALDGGVRAASAAAARRVLVAHHPRAVSSAAEVGYDVVFAGHLHGGQCVLWQRGDLLFPGALFSRWNGLRFAVGGTALFVSNGLADTLPIRFRCPREVVLCSVYV